MDSLKAGGGMLITQGVSRQNVDEEIKKMAVTLSLSRKRYLQSYQQK